jgi:hypothetical protein
MSEANEVERDVMCDLARELHLEKIAETNFSLYQRECRNRLDTCQFILSKMSRGDIEELKSLDPCLFDFLLKAFNDANT